jgi:drug/metabolite transporter (DMT)-like permease
MEGEITYLVSNTIISLYGVLIKYYSNITIFEQLFIRTLAFVIISILGLTYTGNSKHIYKNIFTYDSILLSIVNLSSVYGIYISFKELGLGTTNSLFCTWPIFLYLLSIPILNSKFSIKEFSIIIITLTAMMFILSDNLKLNINNNEIIGLIGLVVSILTHIATILYFKKKDNNIHAYLLQQYGFGLIILIIFFYMTNHTNDIQMKSEYLPIFIYSAIIGYYGFYLNFYSIKILEPFKISILEFLSITLSFLMGFMLFKETTSIIQWLGVIIIVSLNYYSFNFLKI